MPQVRHGESVRWRTRSETAPLALNTCDARAVFLLRTLPNGVDRFARRESNGERPNHCAHFAAGHFDGAMQRSRSSFIQKRKCARADQCRQNCRSTHTAVFNRARVLHRRLESGLCFLQPLSVNRLKAFWFGKNLRCGQMRRVQFVFREITSARSKIRAGISTLIN